ncbi:hypothetical protein FGG08_006113 [Glutinoglossum americanum]|uniref:Uncharacterized protein n=1 Tax=Glutinoglossum americanum TaxID=1670608 RepID=A0A9P8HZ06_9PEZI|nr:hypothetical protein FGG08_006113 [Glutinoglossum americanum]
MFSPMHKDREKDRDRDRDRDKHRDRDRDRDRDRERDKHRHRDREETSHRHSRSSRPHRKSGDKSTRSLATPEHSTSSSSSPKRRGEMPTEHLKRPSSLASLSTSRISLPYPSFSKAHSKESLSRDNVNLRQSLYTQNSTATPPQSKHPAESSERLRNQSKRTQAERSGANGMADGRFAPPSPPPTSLSTERTRTPVGTTSKTDTGSREASGDDARRRRDTESPTGSGRVTVDAAPRSRSSKHSLRKEPSSSLKDGDSTIKASSQGRSHSTKKGRVDSPSTPQPATKNGSDDNLPASSAQRKATSPTPSSELESGIDSDATSRARNQPFLSEQPPPLVDTDESYPTTLDGSSPRTPTLGAPNFPPPDSQEAKASPSPVMVFGERESQPLASHLSPQPPPPPPPPIVPQNIPRVDYLLQNGGLSTPVPRALLSTALPSPPFQPFEQHSPRTPAPPSAEIEKIFGPYHKRLDDFSTILSKNGSLAVATGYRSVARRLLDRLEAVFARDISSEFCSCAMCQEANTEGIDDAERLGKGVGWGDILEWVSGRRELPSWPPFDFTNLFDPINKRGSVEDVAGLMGLGIMGRSGSPLQKRRSSGAQPPSSPFQRLDVDLPEEHRSHYLRQFKKTKEAVNNWLSSCPETPSSPPQEIDDETLVFAILTHLDQADREVFTALISSPPQALPQATGEPTSPKKLRPELLVTTGLALQRLYRLPSPPRDAESAVFLLRHTQLHGVLATLIVISPAEWEVLTSGRFDGFLWSGAEIDTNYSNKTSANPSPAPISRGPSQRPTPISRTSASINGGQSRGQTPFSNGTQSRGTTPFSSTQSRAPFSPTPSRMTTPFYAAATAASRGITPAPGALGNPVPLDEETEIAVLAEVEREIYVGMEALEDAFEALHRKAEYIRRALRERGAGLSMASQARRNPHLGAWGSPMGVEVMAGTPGAGYGWESEAETDDGLEDCQSELMPEDSASNISSSRHRRPKRRNERRTPAPVEEESEEDSRA